MTKRAAVYSIKLCVSLLLLYAISHFVRPDEIIRCLMGADYGLVVAAFLLTPVLVYLKTVKWSLYARQVEPGYRLQDALLALLIGLSYAIITPLGVGELARGAVSAGNKREMLMQAFIDKAGDLFMLLCLASAGYAALTGHLFLSVGVAVVFFPLVMFGILQNVGKVVMALPLSIQRLLIRDMDAPRPQLSRVPCLKIIAITYLFYALFYFQAAVLLFAFTGGGYSFKAICQFPVITASNIIPVTVGGLGLREAVATVLLKEYGISEAVAVNTFFMHFLLSTFVPAVAGAFLHAFPSVLDKGK